MKKLIDLISSRFFVFVFAVLLQVIWLLLISWGMSSLSAPVTMTADILSILLVLWIVNKEINPSYKLAWTILILVLPVFGMVVYLLFGESRVAKKMTEESDAVVQEIENYFRENDKVREKIEALDEGISNQSAYIRDYAKFPLHSHTSTRYYPLGEAMFLDMLEDLKRAKHFIFLEYFIIHEGKMWNSILEILEQKVKEGVEVRFLYDGMCCLSLLPYHYPQELESYGIQCHMFAPIVPALSTRQNNRDHRKIVVIDGKVAFTGGINLADEYINRKERFGHWKDTAIMITGEAVRSFTIMFLEMWSVDKNLRNMPLELFEKYLDIVPDKESEPGDGFIMPYGDSPLDNEAVGEQVYMDILYTAKDYVHIMTPYLILSNEMITALTYAAKRGVDVKIIMPHIPDKWYAFVLAKTYYNELLDAGVKIYEYTPGFVHAKVFTSDDEKAVVGTINLDYRSLYLHFECAVYLYQNEEIPSIEEDFQETFAKCQEVLPSDYKRQKFFDRMAGRVLRILAPLM